MHIIKVTIQATNVPPRDVIYELHGVEEWQLAQLSQAIHNWAYSYLKHEVKHGQRP